MQKTAKKLFPRSKDRQTYKLTQSRSKRLERREKRKAHITGIYKNSHSLFSRIKDKKKNLRKKSPLIRFPSFFTPFP